MFLAKREVYEKQKNRIGKKPIIYIMEKLKSFDIDWEEDFMIAEMIWKMSGTNTPPPSTHNNMLL
jgi:N-acylneuraminate cytidylyltransferase